MAPLVPPQQQTPITGQDVGAKPRPNPSTAPAISYTPTDTTIPPILYEKIPNLELYKNLKEAERKIDLLTTRKAMDFQAINAKINQHSTLKRETGILRVFIYNTCDNQPWQKQLLQSEGKELPEPTAESSWTLRVEGRFLNDTNNANNDASQNLKFSSFLSGISIDILPNQDYPDMQNSPSNIIEWRDESIDQQPDAKFGGNNRQTEFDGLDVKRNGIFNIKSKIAIMIKDQSTSLKLSDEMSRFVGKQEATQQELIYAIWQYVLYKDLFKKSDALSKVPAVSDSTATIVNGSGVTSNFENEEDDNFNNIECDVILSELLRVPNFKFSDLYRLLQPHFRPREPVIIDYEINTRKSTTLGDLIVDIPVSLPSSVSKTQKEIIESTKATYESLTKSDASIQHLNSRISIGIVALQNANARETFYRELSEDPVKFMENWLESQLETFKALKSDEGYEEEVIRRAKYFEDNEDVLKDKIDVLLGSGRF